MLCRSIETHYENWIDTGSEGNGGPEGGGGEVLDPDAELPGDGSGSGGSLTVVGDWSEWSACSMECFGVEGLFPGTQERNRTCTTQNIAIAISQPAIAAVFSAGRTRVLTDADADSCGDDVASADARVCNTESCEGTDIDSAVADVQLYFPSASFHPNPEADLVDLHDNYTVLNVVLPTFVQEVATAVNGLSSSQVFSQYYVATFGTGKDHEDGSASGHEDSCYLQVRLLVLGSTGGSSASDLADDILELPSRSYSSLANYSYLRYLDADYEPEDGWYLGYTYAAGNSAIEVDEGAVTAAGVVGAILFLVIVIVVVVVLVERRRRALRLATYGGVTTSVQTVEPASAGAGKPAWTDPESQNHDRTPMRTLTPRPYVSAAKAKRAKGAVVKAHVHAAKTVHT